MAMAIAAALAPLTLRAQSEKLVDSFTVRGAVVTIVATENADVKIRVDSSGAAQTVVARALDIDAWLPDAREVIAQGMGSDSLRERVPDSGRPAQLRLRPASRTHVPATLELRGRDGSAIAVALGPILMARFLESLARAAARAHELRAGLDPVLKPAAPTGATCMGDIERLRSAHGAPEHTTNYDDGDYHSIEWSYDDGARSYTFVWSDDQPGCRVSVFNSHD